MSYFNNMFFNHPSQIYPPRFEFTVYPVQPSQQPLEPQRQEPHVVKRPHMSQQTRETEEREERSQIANAEKGQHVFNATPAPVRQLADALQPVERVQPVQVPQAAHVLQPVQQPETPEAPRERRQKIKLVLIRD